MDRHALGVLLIGLSAVAFSSAGFFTRLVTLDVWTMLFWRGLFAGLLIFAVILAQEGRRAWASAREIGWAGVAVAPCSTAATVLYINGFRHTSIADVTVIFAAASFLTAGLGWLCLGLVETRTTIAASFAALLGVGVMVNGAVGEGHLIGDVLAFGAIICVAVMMLIIRQRPVTSMLPAACLSALLCPRFGEVPSAASLTGGAVVMAAVVAHVWFNGRSRLAGVGD